MGSKIIFQIVSSDGRMGTQHMEWQTQSTDLLQRIEETIDHIPMDTTVFVVVDLYSEVGKSKKKPSEVIIEEQIAKQKEKENAGMQPMREATETFEQGRLL